SHLKIKFVQDLVLPGQVGLGYLGFLPETARGLYVGPAIRGTTEYRYDFPSTGQIENSPIRLKKNRISLLHRALIESQDEVHSSFRVLFPKATFQCDAGFELQDAL